MKKLLGILFLAFSSSLFNLCEGQYTVLHNFNDTLGANSYQNMEENSSNLPTHEIKKEDIKKDAEKPKDDATGANKKPYTPDRNLKATPKERR